jgi:hypothetical protein
VKRAAAGLSPRGPRVLGGRGRPVAGVALGALLLALAAARACQAAGDEEDDSGEDQPESSAKSYAKPPPRELPEGAAEPLRGAVVVLPFKGMVNPGMGEFTVG